MIKFDELKQGDALSEISYYTIKEIQNKGIVVHPDGDVSKPTITIGKDYVETYLNSSSQYSEEKKVTRTEMQAILFSNPRVTMTVNFNKKVETSDVKKQIYSLYPNKGGKIKSLSEFKKSVNKAVDMKGEERTMVGRHYGKVLDTGRLQFIDMETDTSKSTSNYDARLKQVDPRTINWLIVLGVKYTLK